MPYQIQVGSQVVEFPDSVGQDEAQRILSEQFPATGEDIAGAMQDPAYKPSVDDYLKFEEFSKNKQTDWVNTIAQSVDAAAGMISGAVSQGAQGAVANPLNYIEGAAQGTRQLYGLVAQSQDPASPLFKFKDLVAGTGTPESRYNQFLEARDFANTTARLERGEEGIVVPPEYTNPEFVQGVSMILDPTLALPGIGEVLGAGKLATRAVGKGTQLAGRAITGAARPLERVAGAAERMTAEALGMAPEALRNTAATAGLAGALGIAPEAAAFAAIPAGIRTAREAGEALTRAGENLVTQPSRVGPLEAIGAAPGANLRQRMLGVVGQYGGDAALDASLRGIAGGIEGAAVGTGLGFLSGGEEGAAAGLGSGLAQGAAGALGARGFERLTGKAAKEARAGDLGRFIDAQQDPTTKTLFERVRDQHGVDAASALMDLQGLVRGKFGDVDILYRSNAQMAEKFGKNIRGVQFEQAERPTIFINADIIGKGTGDGPLYTLGHELFHALEKTTQLEGGATEIKDALVGRWVQEGDITRKLAEGAFNDAEIEARFNEYRDKLAAGSPERADQLAQYDTIDKKAGYVASELAAEHFAGLLAGQKPDALLKGFTGLTRQLLDSALTQNASRALADAAATIERTFGVKPTDSVLFPDLKQASPQVNAMLRDLLRARRKLDERITIENEGPGKVLKPQDVSNPIAAKQLVDLGVAEKMPDGSVRNLSDEEIRVREEKDTAAIRTILEGVPGARVVDGEILGRFSPQQLSAIEQSQAVSSRMKDKIRAVNAAMDAGNSLFLNYGAATRRVKNRLTGKFTSKYNSGIRLSQREVLPYSFYLSKADNPVIKAIDISKIRSALDKLTAPDGGVAAGLWDNVDGFMSDLAAYFTNLDAGEGARRSAEIFGLEKAKFLGDFVNEQEKGGRKFVRDFRLDRIGSTAPMDFRARISEDAIQKSKMRWMPAETVGDKSVINSEEGYRIISGAKHRLYGPDGKLIGIYDTQTQAERKADATQARLQPEVRQQQYPARDEVRQTAEAGRGDSAVGRTQGREEGGQELGAVRQAGDVRFMPSDTDYLSAVQQGDTQAAQRMVDEAAKAAGYTVGPVFHGSAARFNQFKRNFLGTATGGQSANEAFFFSTSDRTAKNYASYASEEGPIKDLMRKADQAEAKGDWDLYDKLIGQAEELDFGPNAQAMRNQRREQSKVYNVYLNGRFLEMDAEGKTPAELSSAKAFKQFDGSLTAALKSAKRKGYDGVVFRNLDDAPNLSDPSDHYAIFDPNKIKLSDPITRDDAGNVIPLSQRFKATSEDIRFMPSEEVQSVVDGVISEANKLGFEVANEHSSGFGSEYVTIRDPESNREWKMRFSDHERQLSSITKHSAPNFEQVGNLNLEAAVGWLRKKRETLDNPPKFDPKKSEERLQSKAQYEVIKYEQTIRDLEANRDKRIAQGNNQKAANLQSQIDQIKNSIGYKSAVNQASQFRYMPAGEAGQGAPKRYETVDSFREHWNSLGVRNMTDIRGRGTPYEHIRPSEIEVEKANRNKGLGTAFMQDLTEFADSKGLQIRVNPSDELGATSKGRLEKFYKRFGFVENKPGKNKDYTISERFYRPASQEQRFMPSPDSAMPGAYSFQGGYRAIPGKTKGSLRLYGPAGNLIGIASSLDEAQRILRRKAKQ